MWRRTATYRAGTMTGEEVHPAAKAEHSNEAHEPKVDWSIEQTISSRK